MTFTVELLPPPSANNAFVNKKKGKGRFKSRQYKDWCTYACAAIKGRVPGKDRVGGKFYVAINLPKKMRGDIDNRVKGILDALVASTRIDDDKHMDELHVCRRAEQDFAVVIVRAATPQPMTDAKAIMRSQGSAAPSGASSNSIECIECLRTCGAPERTCADRSAQ